MQDLNDLELLLARKIPLLLVESHEENRALELFTRLAIKRGLALQQWTLTDGLRRLGFGEDVSKGDTQQPADALRLLRERPEGGLFIFCDLHPFLEEPLVIRLLKDIALIKRASAAIKWQLQKDRVDAVKQKRLCRKDTDFQ